MVKGSPRDHQQLATPVAGSDVPVAALGTAAAVTAAAGTGVVIAMRRRRTEA
ncbi:hypothetical protein O3S80_30485 [Streptomyces sp. Lzd4kr]|nr:hypothetical protein [Streptomyces sp. Lzd4kr]